jgi:phosphatidylserine decarboxylase
MLIIDNLFVIIAIIIVIIVFLKFGIVLTILILIFLIAFVNSPDKHYTEYKDDMFYCPSSGYVKSIDSNNGNLKISLFLNVFDNHTQYIPLKSRFISSDTINGGFVPAFEEHSINNTRVINKLYNQKYNFEYKITQITGLLTRRILTLAKTQNDFLPGDRLGFIILGSRVDIEIPIAKVKDIFVKKGKHIYAMEPLLSLI